MQKRLTAVEQFSTFLLVTDSSRFITRWQFDPKLRRNIEQIEQKQTINPECLAYEFLVNLKSKPTIIEQYHLTSYLQEVCYWTSKGVYNRLGSIINSLTWEECFLVGNEVTIKPQKLLACYSKNGGSKITTYAQRRLNTIIADNIYQNRGWKLCSDWGLLKRMSKIKRKQTLTQIAGLTGNKLTEYLLVWQCFVDNYTSGTPQKSRSLLAPNSAQLKLMTEQYNLLAEKLLNFKSILTVDDFKERLEFCSEKARQFTNPSTISYPVIPKGVAENNPMTYVESQEKAQEYEKISQILTQAFEEMSLEYQAIFYLWLGLDLTQQEIVTILQVAYPDFIKEQYQLSRQITKARKCLLDAIFDYKLGKNVKPNQSQVKELKQPLEQWLTEYIELQLLTMVEKCYQEMELNNLTDISSVSEQLNLQINKKLASKLKINIPESVKINNKFNLIIEQVLTRL
jgi:hypothetical protein